MLFLIEPLISKIIGIKYAEIIESVRKDNMTGMFIVIEGV